MFSTLDQLAVNTIRTLSIDGVQKANSGHPGLPLGAELTTGPLGQGFANGIGLAIAEAHQAATYNRPGHTIVDHRTFGLASDGDLMEGVAYESASLAGHLHLGKIVYLYDSNQVTLSGSTGLIFSEDVGKRFEAMDWHVEHVADGNDLDTIEQAIENGVDETERPSLVIVRTTLGYGSPKRAGSWQAHGNPLGAEEVEATKRNLGWPTT